MKKSVIVMLILLSVSAVSAGEQKEGYIITSDRMEATRNGRVVVFIGNVKFIKDEVTLVSDRIESHEDKDLLLASGSVHGVDRSKEEEVVEVFCERAEYDKSLSTGVLTGDPRVIKINLKDETKSVRISGDRIEVFKVEERGTVEGNVVVLQEDIRAESDLLDYQSEMQEIVLTNGFPVIYQNNDDLDAEYSAEKITMLVDDKKIIFEDVFEAEIYMKE